MNVTKTIIEELEVLDYEIKKEGDKLLIGRKADFVITNLLKSKTIIELGIKIVKEQGVAALNQNNAKTINGKHWTLYLSSPSSALSKYKIVDKNIEKEFSLPITQITQYVPHDEAIEEYFLEHGKLPEGIVKRESLDKPIVKIKQNTNKEEEAELFIRTQLNKLPPKNADKVLGKLFKDFEKK